MVPLSCCKECKSFDKETNQMKNKLRCTFCTKYQDEQCELIYNEMKVYKDCSTCAHCKHVRYLPGFVTGEECECQVGLECDTVAFSVKNCPKWKGMMEEENDVEKI